MSSIRSTTPTAKPAATPATAARPATAAPMAQAATSSPQVSREHVAKRAYEKWLKRGCTHGNDMQDWIEAEKEVMAEMRGSGSTSTATRR